MPERTCSVETCGRPVFARGFCQAHYARVRTHGHPDPERPVGRRKIVDLPDGTRQCGRCQAVLPADMEHFPRDPSCAGGMAGTCRGCMRAHHLKFNATHRERLARERREHYARTKGAEVRERKRRWQEREPVRARARILRAGVRDRAKATGVVVDLDLLTVAMLTDWLEREPACPCCGGTYRLLRSAEDPPGACDRSPSLDQIQPGAGYVAGNVALLCWRCNNLKRDATPDELERVARWMRGHGWGWGVEGQLPRRGGAPVLT